MGAMYPLSKSRGCKYSYSIRFAPAPATFVAFEKLLFWGAILGNSQETWKISVGESHNKQNGKAVPKIFYDAIYSDEKNFALDSFF